MVEIEPGRLCGVPTGNEFTVKPCREQIDQRKMVQDTGAGVLVFDQINDIDETEHADADACFLPDLAVCGFGDRLAQVLQAAGKAPFACPRRIRAANEQHPTATHDNRADADQGMRWIPSPRIPPSGLPSLEFLHRPPSFPLSLGHRLLYNPFAERTRVERTRVDGETATNRLSRQRQCLVILPFDITTRH
jgi:hypothetical protein